MNGRNSIFRLSYLLCLGLLLQSCITDDEDTTASITAAKTSVPVSAAAGEEEITIEASGTEWTVTEEIDWLEAAKVDNSTLRVSYEENPDTEERSGTVTAAISDKSVNITVTQEADKRPAFAPDAAIAAQTYVENVTDVMLTLPEATGGDAPLTYSLSPALPAGLEFDAMSREISGTPTEVVEPAKTFTYKVEDEDGDTAELTFTIQIVSSSTPAFVNVMIEAQTYVENVTDVMLTLPEATGGDAPLTYSLTPALPAGLEFDAMSREITGRPTGTTDEATYTYKATDSDDDTAELTFTIVVEADMMPAFALGASIADQMYTEHEAITDLPLPEAMGGNGTLTYSLTPAPPMGLSFDATSRELSGIPAEAIATARNYTYTATDTDGDPVSLTFTITIEGVPAFAAGTTIPAQRYALNSRITTLTLPEAMGGDGTVSYTLMPTLPRGLSFNTSTRELSGTPEVVVSPAATFTYTATDEDSDTDMLTFTIEVEEIIMLTTTTYNIPARGNSAVMISFSGLGFRAGITEWWITARDGSSAGSVEGVTSVSVNDGSRAGRSTTSFTMDVGSHSGLGARNLDLAIQATSSMGGASEAALNFTVRQSGRVANGTIPIRTLEQLHAIRYDRTGNGEVDEAADQTSGTDEENLAAARAIYVAAFPNVIPTREGGTIRYRGYRLENDLDFNDAGSYSDPTTNMPKWAKQNPAQTGGWDPIDRYGSIFDGRGRKISNLYINRSGDAFVGLFGQLSRGRGIAFGLELRLRNIELENPEVTGGTVFVGGLCGRLFTAAMNNCYVSGGTITAGNSASVGGLIGYVASGSSIERSYAAGVTVNGGNNARVGGVVGLVEGTQNRAALMIQCYASGVTLRGGSGTDVGGLAGQLGEGAASEIFQCYVFNHTSSGGTNVGSLVGEQESGTKIHDCYAAGRTYTNIRGTGSGTITESYYQVATEATDGDEESLTVQAKTVDALQDPEGYTDIYINWDMNRADDGADDSWNFGGDDDYPVLKVDFNNNSSTADDVTRQRP